VELWLTRKCGRLDKIPAVRCTIGVAGLIELVLESGGVPVVVSPSAYDFATVVEWDPAEG